MAVLYDSPATASVIPSSLKCELACVPGKIFYQLLSKHAGVKAELEKVAKLRKNSTFHAGLPSWWFKVNLISGFSGTSEEAAITRLQKSQRRRSLKMPKLL